MLAVGATPTLNTASAAPRAIHSLLTGTYGINSSRSRLVSGPGQIGVTGPFHPSLCRVVVSVSHRHVGPYINALMSVYSTVVVQRKRHLLFNRANKSSSTKHSAHTRTQLHQYGYRVGVHCSKQY